MDTTYYEEFRKTKVGYLKKSNHSRVYKKDGILHCTSFKLVSFWNTFIFAKKLCDFCFQILLPSKRDKKHFWLQRDHVKKYSPVKFMIKYILPKWYGSICCNLDGLCITRSENRALLNIQERNAFIHFKTLPIYKSLDESTVFQI